MNNQARYIFLLSYILPIVDLLILNTCFFTISYAASNAGRMIFLGTNNNHIIVCNLIWFVCAGYFGLYRVIGERKMEQVYRGSWKTLCSHSILYVLYLIIHKENHFAPVLVLYFYSLASFLFILSRLIGTSIHFLAIEKFRYAVDVAIIGSNQTAERLIGHFNNEKNFIFYGTLGDDESIYHDQIKMVTSGLAERLASASRAGVRDVYVTKVPERMLDVHDLIREADRNGLRLKFIPDIGPHLFSSFNINYLGNQFPVITIRPEPLEEISSRFKKRFFDLVFSSFLFVTILWWLLPLIALIIKLDSRGPVFFIQSRAGRNNQIFSVFKFRTMKVVEATDQFEQAKKDDPRITRVGAYLRKYSIDELPQFINVMIGNMSVVGPRPHPLKLNDQFQKIIDKYMVRHFVKPGITGWAQVNGYRGETKDSIDMENRIKFDIHYLENWTAMFDVKIVFMTIINMLRGEDNAY